MPMFEFSSYSIVINAPEEWDDAKGDEVSAEDAWETIIDRIRDFITPIVKAIDPELEVEIEDTSG